MPDWFTIIVAACAGVSAVGALVAIIYKTTRKVDNVVNREYPCVNVKENEKRIEALEGRAESMESDIATMKRNQANDLERFKRMETMQRCMLKVMIQLLNSEKFVGNSDEIKTFREEIHKEIIDLL